MHTNLPSPDAASEAFLSYRWHM